MSCVLFGQVRCRWRPYRVECTGSLPTSEVKRRRARLVLGWGTAREDLRVLPAFDCRNKPLAQISTQGQFPPAPMHKPMRFVIGDLRGNTVAQLERNYKVPCPLLTANCNACAKAAGNLIAKQSPPPWRCAVAAPSGHSAITCRKREQKRNPERHAKAVYRAPWLLKKACVTATAQLVP